MELWGKGQRKLITKQKMENLWPFSCLGHYWGCWQLGEPRAVILNIFPLIIYILLYTSA